MKKSLTLMIEEPRVELSGEKGAAPTANRPTSRGGRCNRHGRGDKRNGRRPSRGEVSPPRRVRRR